jgi:hypothetical protein
MRIANCPRLAGRAAFATFATFALTVGCGGGTAPMSVGPGTAPEPLTIPADVGMPTMSCGGGVGVVPLQLPCLLGMAPVSEVDCALAGAPSDQKIRFVLPLSIPNGAESSAPVLGQPMPFHADLLPFESRLPPSTLDDGKYTPQSITGTVVLTQLSPADQTLDGWFPHLDFVWSTTDGSTLSCTLDKGRFTAVPGAFL